MKILLTIFVLFINFAFSQAPESFIREGKKYVFMDIESVTSNFHFTTLGIEMKSQLNFSVNEDGYALFDLYKQEVRKVLLNNKMTASYDVELPEVDQAGMLSIDTKVYQGQIYTLEVYHFFSSKEHDEFNLNAGEVDFYFKFCDGKGVRQLLERYIPSNLQFDQYPLKLNLTFAKEFKNHEIMSNGKVVTNGDSHEVFFPSFYNSASHFFHIFPKDKYQIHEFKSQGVNFKIYFSKLNSIYNKEVFRKGYGLYWSIDKIMQEVTDLYGKFPYEEFIVFLSEHFAGIEHAGATRSSRFSLRHEIFHMYMGRGAMPVDGRSAWIDEGLARWADGGAWYDYKRWFKSYRYALYENLPEGYLGLQKRSQYQRSTWDYKTDFDPYLEGGIFFGYLDQRMNGHLKPFLKQFIKRNMFKTYSQESFFKELKSYISDHPEFSLSVEQLDELIRHYF